MPRFSVIVGVYNQGSTLPKLIESLVKQSFTDFEVHFCDDGSTDESADLINMFISQSASDRYFYHHQENKGMRLSKAINMGIKAAKGEHCVFIMADSFPELDYLSILDQYVEPYRMVCGVRFQIDNGKGVDVDWRIKKNIIPEYNTVLVNAPWDCITGNGLSVPTEALRLYGGWCEDLEGYGGDDTELVGRLFYKGYVAWSIVNLKLYHHWHKSSSGNQKNIAIVTKKILQYDA